jgi:hypothetical protein
VVGYEVTINVALADGDRLRPGPGGVAGAGRRPVRLLPARSDHGRRRPAVPHQDPTDAGIDEIENVGRGGTYSRIREATEAVAAWT